MTQMKLITEQSYDIEIFEDAKKDNNLYIVGLFSSAEKENANKRKYPAPILKREITKFIDEKIKNKSAIGQLDHPSSMDTDLEKAAILIESLEWRGNDVYGKAKVLSTPAGNTARALIEGGVKLGISSRGLGNVNEDGIVGESYKLITYDLVSSPSTPGGWVNGIYEAKTFDIPSEDDNLKKADKELEKELAEAQKERTAKIIQMLETWCKPGKKDPEDHDTTDVKGKNKKKVKKVVKGKEGVGV